MTKRIGKAKKLWLVALLALLLGAMLCVAAGAETYSGTCGDSLTWSLDSTTGELIIEGSGAMYDYAETSVETRAPWYPYRESVKTVTLSEGVTHIGAYAFEDCAALADMPTCTGLKTIGNYAFKNCFGFTAVHIPESVTDIGIGAFAVCKNMTALTVDAGNGVYYGENNCIIEKESKTLVLGCQNSVIPEDVTAIGVRAFRGCEGLVSMTIPDSVTAIGEYAFNGCTSLKSITIPKGVTAIEKCTFLDCTALADVTLPKNVTYIGDRAFGGCKSLKSVTVLPKTAKIYDSKYTVSDTATIYGYNGSTAQAYAKAYGRDFGFLVDAHEHSFSETLSYDNTNHWYACSGCGEKKDAAAHSWDGGVLKPAESIMVYTCTACTATKQEQVTVYGVTVENHTVFIGETVTVNIKFEDTMAVKSIALEGFDYDRSALELISGEWIGADKAVIKDIDLDLGMAMLTFEENTTAEGLALSLTFKMVDQDKEGEYEIGCNAKVTQMDGPEEVTVDTVVIKGTLSIRNHIRGDMNSDERVNSNDAIYLLRHVLFTDKFPILQSGDVNADGFVNSNDAIYLLRHALFPDRFPLL